MIAKSNIFHFSHQWTVQGSLPDAFRLISDPRTFQQWFPIFKQITLSSPTGHVTPGARVVCKARAALPYTVTWDVTVTDIRPNQLTTFVQLKLCALSMSGTVRYTFRQLGENVIVDNDQTILSDRSFPRPLHSLFQRLFAWNHAWAMRRGEQGLRRILRKMQRRCTSMRLAA